VNDDQTRELVAFLSAYPDATASAASRAVRARRADVLAAVKSLRANGLVSTSAGGCRRHATGSPCVSGPSSEAEPAVQLEGSRG
jgi:hypothetical protein